MTYKVRFLEEGKWGVVRCSDNWLYEIWFYSQKDAEYIIKQWEAAE